jgi:hypothetical protein
MRGLELLLRRKLSHASDSKTVLFPLDWTLNALRGKRMTTRSALGVLAHMSRAQLGVFRGSCAVELGVSRKQLSALCRNGVIEREYPDTYRMTAVPRSNEQSLRAALLWAGDESAAAERSAGEVFGLEGVRAVKPEVAVPGSRRLHSDRVIAHRYADLAPLMVRTHRGIRVTGVEATLVALAASLESEPFEIAFEDARRRRLTSVAAVRAYIARYPGRRGTATLRALLDELDPVHPSRSTLEVKTRRLLVANGFTDFVREFPLTGNGRTYYFDFCFERSTTILETNGRRWHDDPADYEDDNEKWSIPARNGYRIVFATWAKVTKRPEVLLAELHAALRRAS